MFWCIDVLYIISIYDALISLYCIFCDCICDVLAILVSVEISECPFPSILCTHFSALDESSIGIEIDRYAFWSLSITVVIVIPCLCSRDADLFLFMTVRYHESFFHASCNLACVAFYFRFCNRVVNLLSIFIFRKVCKLSLPLIAFIQHECLACFLAIL